MKPEAGKPEQIVQLDVPSVALKIQSVTGDPFYGLEFAVEINGQMCKGVFYGETSDLYGDCDELGKTVLGMLFTVPNPRIKLTPKGLPRKGQYEFTVREMDEWCREYDDMTTPVNFKDWRSLLGIRA